MDRIVTNLGHSCYSPGPTKKEERREEQKQSRIKDVQDMWRLNSKEKMVEKVERF
jgi:hypothetical protein